MRLITDLKGLIPGTSEHLARQGIVNPVFNHLDNGRYKAVIPFPVIGRDDPGELGYHYVYDHVANAPPGYSVFKADYSFPRLTQFVPDDWLREALLQERMPFFDRTQDRLYLASRQSAEIALLQYLGSRVLTSATLYKDPNIYPALLIFGKHK